MCGRQLEGQHPPRWRRAPSARTVPEAAPYPPACRRWAARSLAPHPRGAGRAGAATGWAWAAPEGPRGTDWPALVGAGQRWQRCRGHSRHPLSARRRRAARSLAPHPRGLGGPARAGGKPGPPPSAPSSSRRICRRMTLPLGDVSTGGVPARGIFNPFSRTHNNCCATKSQKDNASQKEI